MSDTPDTVTVAGIEWTDADAEDTPIGWELALKTAAEQALIQEAVAS